MDPEARFLLLAEPEGAPETGGGGGEPTPAVDQPGQVEEPDFAALAEPEDFEESDELEVPETPESASAEVTSDEPEGEKPEKPPETAAAPEPVPPAEPSTPEAQPPAEAAPPTVEPALTPEKIEAAYKEYEESILPQLEKHYALSEEQAEALDENPAQVIPQLAARIHYQSQVAAYTGIMSQLPAIVSRVLEVQDTAQKAENAFFDRWPDLKDPKHGQVIDTTVRAYRAANPNMTQADMIEKAGVAIMLSLGLDPRPAAQQQQTEVPPSPPPARPSGPAGAGAPRSAGGGGSVNEFEELAEFIIEEG